MPHLSLLSRGIGQVAKTAPGKLQVNYEPEDYLNWKSHENYFDVSKTLKGKHTAKGCLCLCLPKTYSTRMGALVLYSEDLAESSWKRGQSRRGQQGHWQGAELQTELYTLRDLARAILAYGGRQKGPPWQPHLHVLRQPDAQSERQLRPGYSARRYLFTLSRTWHRSLTDRLQCAGCIRDPLLFQEYSQIHGKVQQDLSAVPGKYHFLPVLPSFWNELSQQIHIGQSYLFLKESGSREKLAESQETPSKEKAQVLVGASLREQKLGATQDMTQSPSSPAAPQGTQWKELQVASSRASRTQSNQQHYIENPGNNQKLKKTSEGFVRSTVIHISHLLSEKSHSTFYGGYFPERKMYYNAKQGHRKSQDINVKRLNENSFLPPVPSAMGSEQDATREEQIKIPETLKLPTIPEDRPRARTHRKKHLRSSKNPKELLVIPLLVQMQTGLKTRPQKGALCCTSKAEVDDPENLLAASLDDLTSGLEGRAKQHQTDTGEYAGTQQGSFPQAPTGNQEFALERRKAEVRRINAGKKNNYQKESCTEKLVPALGVQFPTGVKENPGAQGSWAGAEAVSSSPVLPGSTSKALPVGSAHRGLPEEGKEHFSSTSVCTVITIPDGRGFCQDFLGSVQDMDAPTHSSFNPGEGDSKIPLETGACLHSYSQETSLIQEMSNKEVPGMQTRQTFLSKKKMENRMRQETRPGSEYKLAERNKSTVSEFREQSQDDLSRSLRFMQDTQASTDSGSPLHSFVIPCIPEAEEQEDSNSVTGFQVTEWGFHTKSNNSPQFKGSCANPDKQGDPECTILPLKTCSDLSVYLTEEMQDKELESDSSLLKSPGHQETEKEKSGVRTSNSEKKFMRGKNAPFKTAKSEKKTASTSFAIGTGAAETKTKKSISHTLTKMDPTSETEISSKNKPHHRTEFVVGKPKEKRTGKKRVQAEREQAAANRHAATSEPTAKMGAEGPGTKPGRSASGSSCPASPSPPKEDEAFPEDHQDHPRNHSFHLASSHLPPTLASGTHTVAAVGRNNRASEVPPRKWQEGKLAGEKRTAKAESRRLQVERRRKEEEQQKGEKRGQQEHLEKMKAELEEELQRTEDVRLQKQQLEKDRRRQEEAAASRKSQLDKAAQESTWQQQEDYHRKLQPFHEPQLEEQVAEKQRPRETWLEKECQQLVEMTEQCLEYDRRIEEKTRYETKKQRKNAQEEARLALEEAERQTQLLIRRKAALEQHLQLQHGLLIETTGLEHTQDISRPWVFSYFQLLEKLDLKAVRKNK